MSREAFRKGLVDYRQESDPGFWATGYDIPAKEKGWLVMGRNNFKPYVGIISGLALNTRREHLKDVRVREALTLALDYDWYNRAINYNFYDRAESYFPGTFLAATELPGAGERALLDAYRDELPPRLFTQRFALPHSSGFGRNRQALVRARALLREAGWEVRDGVLVNEHGEPFELAFLANTAGRQRTFLLYVNQLQRLGIESRIRLVETSQYVNLLRDFNFDVVATAYGIAFPPGVELIAYFHSRAAWTPQTRNLSGIELGAVDAMIRHVLNARTVEELTDASRALDRILLWHYYMIPLIGLEGPRVVYWDKFGRPERDAEFRTSFPDAWWYDPAKAARIEQGLAAGD